MSRSTRARQTERRGVAAVEMAIVAPVLLTFAFGVMEVTNGIYLQQSLQICAYEGARVALMTDTTAANVEATCNRLLQARGVKGATITVTPANYESAAYGTEIKVEVTATIDDNALAPMLVIPNRELSGTVVLMKEN